jgi:EAL domain-containing protein (putative c-di-GMP-specific phosphodiesterase class I)
MKQLGCRVAISGFGRNQAAMETLKRLSVDFLKIDGGIVRQLLTYPASLAQAAAIVRLARTLGLDTIAEMVEDEPTMAKVRELKVDFAQGFGISRPRALGDVPAQVNENP